MSFQISVLSFLGYIVKSLGHKAVTCSILLATPILSSVAAAAVHIGNSALGFPSLHILPTQVCECIDDSHCDRYDLISHWGFNLHFSDD